MADNQLFNKVSWNEKKINIPYFDTLSQAVNSLNKEGFIEDFKGIEKNYLSSL